MLESLAVANPEHADYIKVDLSSNNPFGLTFFTPEKNRNLFIEEPTGFGEGVSLEAQDLLRTVMMAHLVIRHFPKVIETNFKVGSKEFLDELYKHYGYPKPKIIRSEKIITPEVRGTEVQKKHAVVFANAHSGGLDSLYRAAKLLYEGKTFMMAHIRNLNPTGTLREAVASRNQAKVMGVDYEEVRLRNGTDNTGYSVMRTRDMFLALVAAIAAKPYGVKKILIEGDMRNDPSSHFSEYGPAWEFFNNLLNKVGINSAVEGIDAHDIETIGEVIIMEQRLGIDILPMVQNCFTPQNQMGNNRRKWERETPVLAKRSPDHWCGSCAKCRRMTLGRLFYHDPRFRGVASREIQYFVNDTRKWLEAYPNNKELTSESFIRHLENLV